MFSSLAASPIEQKVRAATKDDGYKPSEKLLAEIADATHSYKHLPIIMNVIWKRLNDDTRNWKKLYKGLLVLEYIMKNGSDHVRIEIQVRRAEVLTLGLFQHGGTFDGKDIGLYVRDKAKEILEWLDANPPGSKKSAGPKSPTSHSSNPSPVTKSLPQPQSPPQPQPVQYQGPPPQQFQSPPQPFHPGPGPAGPPQPFHPGPGPAGPLQPQVQVLPRFQSPPPQQFQQGGPPPEHFQSPPPQQVQQPPPQQFQQPPPQQFQQPSPQQFQQGPPGGIPPLPPKNVQGGGPPQPPPQPFQHGGGFDPFATADNDPFASVSSPPHQH